MSLKAKVEAIIYAAEEPITLEQISILLKDATLADLAAAKDNKEAREAAEAASEAEEPSQDGPVLLETPSDVETPVDGDPSPEADVMEQPASESVALESDAVDGEAVESAAIEGEAAETAVPETEADQAEAPQGEVAAEGPEEDAPIAETAESASDAIPATEAATTDEAPAPSDEPAASAEPAPAESAAVVAPESTSRKRKPQKTEQEIAEDKAVRARLREVLVELVTDYASEDRGMEIRQVAGGFRMATKPEHHDVVRAFAKSLKPPIRLSLAALETLAVIAYKQPVTGPEITDIRGVESAGVIGTLLDRKLITTAGRKQVIGRPMQYKTSKDFLLRFGLNDINEMPSMEEFSQLASDATIELTQTEQQQSPSLFEPEAEPTANPVDAAEPETTTSGEESAEEATQESAPSGDGGNESQPEAQAGNHSEAEHSNSR
jgi:segregation and condensation protein B